MENKRNKGIEYFRLVAAFMVVCIHTFPFKSINKDLDIYITLTLFRVAVPFFFVTTGYFILGKWSVEQTYPNYYKIKKFILKQCILYIGIVSIYLPLSFYSSVLNEKTTFFQFIRMIIFDGTLYHLWYFPAVILGVFLVALLLYISSTKITLIISITLYLVGLGGDSWFGILSHISIIEKFYQLFFAYFGYTRNGLFFAPLFLSLGAYLYRSRYEVSTNKIIKKMYLIIFCVLLLIESFLLHTFSVPKHDSMYFLLPIIVYLSFQLISEWDPKINVNQASEKSFLIYIFHPLFIVLVHFCAKFIRILDNGFLNFSSVFLLSYLFALFILRMMKKRTVVKEGFPRAVKYVSVDNVKNNIVEIKKILHEGTSIMAVIKADAYGCDAVLYGKTLNKIGINFFAVATIDEAIYLRKNGIEGEILILGYTSPKRVKELKKYTLTQSIISEDHAKDLDAKKISIQCHLKIDTGMNRLGVKPNIKAITTIYKLSFLNINGVYSHLGSSNSLESEAIQRTHKQISTYNNILKEMKNQEIDIGLTHLQSSYGLMNYPELHYDYVRLGIILYGLLNSSKDRKEQKIKLTPVLSVKASLISKKWVQKGEYIGYGIEKRLTEKCLVGVVSIGYADGIPRSLSESNFKLSYGSIDIIQIGAICMDMLMVDLTSIPEIEIESQITVISDFECLADEAGTFSNELISRLSERLTLPRQK